MAEHVELSDGYGKLLEQLKSEISSSRIRASLKVNEELVRLYWRIGKEIVDRQEQEGYGTKVIERLSRDLRREFPEMKGLSATNLDYMRRFAMAWPEELSPQAVGKLPWGHNRVLLDKLDSHETREWYAAKTVENGWSRNVLALQIDTKLHERHSQALTNFKDTLPEAQSDLAVGLVKDPYNFEFLGVAGRAAEREVHEGLIGHVRSFLLELGAGFAFVGSEYHLEIDGRDFYVDLLFYHLKLRCYVVIELKSGDFEPEYAGKMNFYLSAVDDIVRDPKVDQPTIGILLCRSKSRVIAEYALRDTKKPMGVSSYLTDTLPEQLAKSLPTPAEITNRLETHRTCHPEKTENRCDGPAHWQKTGRSETKTEEEKKTSK